MGAWRYFDRTACARESIAQTSTRDSQALAVRSKVMPSIHALVVICLHHYMWTTP